MELRVKEELENVRYPTDSGKLMSNAFLGMLIFLAAEVMFFVGMFGGLIVLRFGSEHWPPLGAPPLPIFIGGINTVVLLLSSVTMVWAYLSIHKGEQVGLRRGLVLTLLLGVLFLVSQLIKWHRMGLLGLHISTNVYGSVFYALTGLHGLHVLTGIFVLLVATRRAFLHHYSKGRHVMIQLTGMYWHFVVAVWVVLYTVLYLL